MSLSRLVGLGVAFEVLYSLLYVPLTTPDAIVLFMTVHSAGFILLAYLVRAAAAPGLLPSSLSAQIALIAGFALLFRLTLLPLAPVGSDDMYRYVWDGRVWLSGLNPYAYAPNDQRLAHLATDILPALVNAPSIPTGYPPLAEGLFLASVALFGTSFAWMKFLLVVCDIATILGLIVLLRDLGRSAYWALLYAWSPMPVLYFGLDGHIDALGIPFMIAFLVFVGRKKNIGGAILLGASALAKLYPVFLAPLMFREVGGWKKWWIPFVPLFMLISGFVPVWLPGWATFSGLRTFGSTWEFNGSVYWPFYYLLGSNEAAHTACALVFALFIVVVMFKKSSLIDRVFLSFTGFICLSPTVHPWYLTWIAALLVVRWSTPVFVFLGLSVLSNIVVLQYRLGMGWHDQLWIVGIEYGIPFLLVGWQIAVNLREKRLGHHAIQ